MMNRLPYFLLLGFSTLWCAGFVTAALVSNDKFTGILFAIYEPVCHQLSGHSFHIGGSPLAVCTRCSAIYSAFLLGVIIFPAIRTYQLKFTTYRYYIILLTLPMIIDVIASWTTGYTSTTFTRVFSGGLFGFGISLLIVPMFIEAIQQIRNSKTTQNKLIQENGGNV